MLKGQSPSPRLDPLNPWSAAAQAPADGDQPAFTGEQPLRLGREQRQLPADRFRHGGRQLGAVRAVDLVAGTSRCAAKINGKIVCADNAGSAPLIANGPRPPVETFKVVHNANAPSACSQP